MLIRFTIENFQSYENETVLELVASGKYQTPKDHEITIGNSVTLLKHGVIFGPNASGKSKMIEAFAFYKECLLHGLDLVVTSDLFCKNKKANQTKPSSFEMQFSIDDDFYAYGFSVLMSEARITEEWLYELGKTGTRKEIFTRDESAKINYVPRKYLNADDKTRFNVYRDDFEGNKTRLFLSEMNRNKKLESSSKLSEFTKVFSYLAKNIIVVNPNTSVTNFQRYYQGATLEKVNELIKTFDTGIARVVVEETNIEEIKQWLPLQVFDDLMRDIKTQIAKSEGKKVRISMRIGRNFFNIIGDATSLKISTLRTEHNSSPYRFTFAEESDGTQRLFELLDVLLTDKEDALFVIDELDRSLHPMLTWRFIEEFMNRNKTHRRQLVFTTHEPYIMDQRLFRLDEIWFVDKDKNDSSILYSLDRFKERKDKKISKTYLEGRYGAIPVFSGMDFDDEGCIK